MVSACSGEYVMAVIGVTEADAGMAAARPPPIIAAAAVATRLPRRILRLLI